MPLRLSYCHFGVTFVRLKNGRCKKSRNLMDSRNKAQVSRMRLRNGRCKKSRNFMDWQTKPQVVDIISSTQAEPGRVGEVLKFPPHMKLPSFNSSSTWEMFFDMGPAISLEERVELLFNLFYEPFSPRQRSEKLLTQTEPDDSSGSIGEVGRRWLLKPPPPMTIPTVVSSSTWEIFFELGPAISFEGKIEKLLELFLDPVSPQLRSTSTDSFPPSEHFDDEEVGTFVSLRNSEERVINSQVFVRDSIPSAFDFMMDGEPDTVRNCSLKTVCIQSWEKQVERFKLGEAVMLASFKVLRDQIRNLESMMADFGKNAVGRVVGFRTFSTLLCTDACCIIGRIMGVHGCPIEIQALFLVAMKSALPLLEQDPEGKMLVKRLDALILDLIDTKQLNDIYCLSRSLVSIFPDSLPEWIFDIMLARGGYFIGNISPARMDFGWFALGSVIANLLSLVTPEQSIVIIDLIESRWKELVGQMPLKVCNYPAIGSHEWQIITGCDRRNTGLRYPNGRSWPVLLWMLAATCMKNGQPQIARRAIELAETRLLRDNWPKRFIWKRARKLPMWSIARYFVAKMMLEDVLGMVSQDEDEKINAPLRRSNSCRF